MEELGYEIFNCLGPSIILDEDLNIVELNDKFLNTFKYTRGHPKLKNAQLIFPKEFIQQISEFIKNFSTKKTNTTVFTTLIENNPVHIKVKIINNKYREYAILLISKKPDKNSSTVIDTSNEDYDNLKKAFDALTKVTANAVSTLKLDELLEKLLNRLVEVMSADAGIILLHENNSLIPRTIVGFQINSSQKFKINIGEGFAGTIAKSMKPLYIEDARKDKRIVNSYIKENGIKSMFGVPLKRDGELIGVLHLDWKRIHSLKDYETRLLEITAERCAMSIRNSQYYQRIVSLKEELDLRFKSMPIACIVWDTEFRVQSWNPAAEKIFGYTEEEVKGKHAQELIVPEDINSDIEAIWQKILQGDQIADNENKNITKSGKTILCRWTNTPLSENDGNVVGAISMAEDITELKEAQSNLKNKISELTKMNRYEQAIRNIIEQLQKNTDPGDVMNIAVSAMSNAIDIVDNISIYQVNGNEAVLQAHKGYPEWFTERVRRIPKPKGFTWKTITEGRPSYVNDIEKDSAIGPAGKKVGTKSYASMPVFYEGDVVGVININSYTKDAFGDDEIILLEKVAHHVETAINNARKTERIRKSEERFSAFMNNLPAAAFIKDEEGKYIFINRTYEETFGIQKKNLIGKTDHQIFSEEAAKHFTETDRKVFEQNTPVQTIEESKIDSKTHYCFVCKFPIYNGGESCRHLGGVAIDITERQKAKEKIEEQAALLNIANDAILVRDLEDNIVFWNKGAEKLYGWTEEELVGRRVPRESFNIDEGTFDTVKSKGEWSGELKQKTKDNREIVVMSSRTLVKDKNNDPKSVLIVNKDISDNKRMQKELLQAQRMESIGTLAGGIAHDLNNTLMPIMMSIQLLRDYVPGEDDKYHKWLNIIEESTHRGSNLVSQVLSFARGVGREHTILQPNSLIKELIKILDQTFPKSIKIKSNLPDELWSVSGDITQLHQVLMNLCVNARDAMPEGGTLSITVNNFNIDENYAKMIPDAVEGDYIIVSVSDTGEGISQDNMNKIFDPFFTTKDPGKGTGLGLSTSFRIIKDHGGFINVYSDRGEGTMFKVFLPAARDTKRDETKQRQIQEIKKGNGELILVVDDEVTIRDITKITLENNGYRVLAANDGAEAIAVYSKHIKDTELVIMDMMMPNMDGPSSIKVLRKINPRLKIIATSGLRDSQKPLDKMEIEVNAVLTKPYTSVTILNKIADILGK